MATSATQPGVMVAQLRQLLRMGTLPNVDVRIVPLSAGLWWAGCSPFSLFEFEQQVPAVCLVNLNSVTVLEDRDSVAGYRRALEDLDAVAATPEQSRDLLAHYGQRWSLGTSPPPTGFEPAV